MEIEMCKRCRWGNLYGTKCDRWDMTGLFAVLAEVAMGTSGGCRGQLYEKRKKP